MGFFFCLFVLFKDPDHKQSVPSALGHIYDCDFTLKTSKEKKNVPENKRKTFLFQPYNS